MNIKIEPFPFSYPDLEPVISNDRVTYFLFFCISYIFFLFLKLKQNFVLYFYTFLMESETVF